MHRIGLGILMCLACVVCAHGDTIAVWNFNDAVSDPTGVTDEFRVDWGIGTMYTSFALANVGNYAGSVINSQNGDPAGRALSLSGSANNGGSLTWMVGTTGFESIMISFAIQRTGTGFADNQFLFTADFGASWITFTPHFTPGLTFASQMFDLSGIESLNNNPGAGFRIVFGGATSSSGNNRIDNLAVSGTAVPEPSTLTLTAAGFVLSFLVRPQKQAAKASAASKG